MSNTHPKQLRIEILEKIVNAIKQQAICPLYGIESDEVSDGSNSEQVYCYLQNFSPVEKLVELILCDVTTGEALVNNILSTLQKLSLILKNCHLQCYYRQYGGSYKWMCCNYKEGSRTYAILLLYELVLYPSDASVGYFRFRFVTPSPQCDIKIHVTALQAALFQLAFLNLLDMFLVKRASPGINLGSFPKKFLKMPF